jgi:hypothetical protein
MYEMTMPDPLETTVPDPVGPREPRLTRRQRRALEAGALVVLVPALLGVQWLDDTSHMSPGWKQQQDVAVVRRGGTGALGRSRWRLLGRDTHTPLKSGTTPSGAVRLTLVLEVRALDAQGVKDAKNAGYQVRDREGHIWSAFGEFAGDHDLTTGATVRVTVTANVPEKVVSRIVLEVRSDSAFGGQGTGRHHLLRFAH